VVAVHSNGDGRPRANEHGLAGNPDGFKIRLSRPLRRSDAAYSTVERVNICALEHHL
jgi:hypothetical protein